MTLTFVDVRIAQFGVETSTAAIDAKARGALAAIGRVVGYEQLFRKALAGTDGLQVPWVATSPKASRFWKRYVTGKLRDGEEELWPGLARTALVPIRAGLPLPVPQLHPGVRRGFGEALVWPLGVGLSWNNWIQAELSVDDLVTLIGAVRHDAFPVAAADGTNQVRTLADLYHSALTGIRNTAWGTAGGLRSEPMTVISIADARWAGDTPAATEPALKTLRDAIGSSWGVPPTTLADDRLRDTEGTIYAAPRLRLVWIPSAFLTDDRLHRVGCLHRNLVQSSLQVEMLATATRMLNDAKVGGTLPAAYVPFRDQILALSDDILKHSGYSSPFLVEQLSRGSIVAAREALRS